jgi:hypothetical protein
MSHGTSGNVDAIGSIIICSSVCTLDTFHLEHGAHFMNPRGDIRVGSGGGICFSAHFASCDIFTFTVTITTELTGSAIHGSYSTCGCIIV